MANIDCRQQAFEALKENFDRAKAKGRIDANVKFDPKRTREVSVGKGMFRLVYARPDGQRDSRVKPSHKYPALITSYAK